MCGIAGVWSARDGVGGRALADLATRMADAIRHRGPDGDGVWADEGAGIALGHRRLSIIDLSETGRQPMVSADGRYVISYNGEVYNFPELRAELEAAGTVFRGTSDTEVVLEAIARWGLAASVKRFVGMFAFALWDRETRTLSLVRDRLGIKPLYYARAEGLFLFGSELKALRACEGWQPALDRGALAAYLRFGYVPAPHTIYRGARKLEPGCILSVAANHEAAIERYWDLDAVIAAGRKSNDEMGEEEAVDGLERALSQAVAGRMVADVPVGAFLSGGIDSSTVVALMQKHGDRPVRTFTIGFAEADLNEAAHAKAVAAHLGTDHTELYVTPTEALEVIPRLADLYDEPFADSSQIPTFLVSEMTRRHVVVALSGDGGDELFCGYNRYMQGRKLAPYFAYLPRWLRRLGAAGLRGVPPQTWTGLFRAVPARWRPPMAGDKLHKLADVLPDDQLGFYRGLVSHWPRPETIAADVPEPPGIVADPSVAERVPDFVERMQYLDTVTYLPDDILTKVDRASMAVSLEARVPLIDHRVVAFAWSLPMSMKLRGGTGKWLLRRLLDRHVPRELVQRPKAGFAVPLDRWLRGPLRDWAEDLLEEGQLEADGILNAGAVREAWDAHLSGRRNFQSRLWAVLVFQAWKRRWMA